MKKRNRFWLIGYFRLTLPLLFLFGISYCAYCQTPSDAIMMNGKRICIAGIYTNEGWDQYWEGTLLRENKNVTPFTRNTYALMIAAGITDRINIIANMPYVTTKSSGGFFQGAEGFQDFGAWLKAEALKKQLGPGNFTTHAVIGFTTPISNYNPDYAPFSLGLGCSEAQGRLILQYLFEMGIYTRITGAYLLRGTSELDRDYYYTDKDYYSNKVDIPNATHFTGTLGCWFFNKKFKIECNYEIFNTLEGHDIRRQDAGFPSNKMEATSINFGGQYFPYLGFGVIANYSTVLEGRNVGKSSGITVGLTYQFGITKS